MKPETFELLEMLDAVLGRGRVYKVENSKADTLFGGGVIRPKAKKVGN